MSFFYLQKFKFEIRDQVLNYLNQAVGHIFIFWPDRDPSPISHVNLTLINQILPFSNFAFYDNIILCVSFWSVNLNVVWFHVAVGPMPSFLVPLSRQSQPAPCWQTLKASFSWEAFKRKLVIPSQNGHFIRIFLVSFKQFIAGGVLLRSSCLSVMRSLSLKRFTITWNTRKQVHDCQSEPCLTSKYSQRNKTTCLKY